jgi:hypothetical protein
VLVSVMPLTSDWAIFSINLSRILSFPYLPTRAGEALIGPVGAITATSLVLVPEQPSMLLGAEVILIGLAMVVAPIVFQARRLARLHGRFRAVRAGGQLDRIQPGVRRRRRALVRGCSNEPLLDRRGRHSWHYRGRIERVGADGRDSALRP